MDRAGELDPEAIREFLQECPTSRNLTRPIIRRPGCGWTMRVHRFPPGIWHARRLHDNVI